MNFLYYRIFFTLKKGLLWLGNDNSDSPRFTAVLILSLFTFFNLLTLSLFFLITVKSQFTIHPIIGILLLLGLLAINWYTITKKKGKKIESMLSEKWDKEWNKEWNKNILITIGYFILSILFISMSVYYAHKNPIISK